MIFTTRLLRLSRAAGTTELLSQPCSASVMSQVNSPAGTMATPAISLILSAAAAPQPPSLPKGAIVSNLIFKPFRRCAHSLRSAFTVDEDQPSNNPPPGKLSATAGIASGGGGGSGWETDGMFRNGSGFSRGKGMGAASRWSAAGFSRGRGTVLGLAASTGQAIATIKAANTLAINDALTISGGHFLKFE